MIYITNLGVKKRKKKKRRRKKPWLGWLKLEALKALCVKKNPIFNLKNGRTKIKLEERK
jgi:hypothetical protein